MVVHDRVRDLPGSVAAKVFGGIWRASSKACGSDSSTGVVVEAGVTCLCIFRRSQLVLRMVVIAQASKSRAMILSMNVWREEGRYVAQVGI